VEVKVDATKCDGFGTCATHCPEVFKLDEWGYAYVEVDAEPPPDVEDRLRRAIVDCPVHAIVEVG
jgi:ferredoxin